MGVQDKKRSKTTVANSMMLASSWRDVSLLRKGEQEKRRERASEEKEAFYHACMQTVCTAVSPYIASKLGLWLWACSKLAQ